MLSVCPNVDYYIVADKYLYGKHNMPSEPITLTSSKIDVPITSLHKYLLEKLFIHSDQYLIECDTNISHGFYELESDSRSLANAFRHLGLQEGDIFGIFGENSYEYLVLYIGGIIAGAVVYGIASTDTFQEVSNKIIQRNIKYLAISDKNISIAKRISEGIPITQKIIVFNGGYKMNDKFVLYSELNDTYEPIDDDLMSIPNDPKQTECLILNTSGSFGPPKPVVFTHYSIVSAIEIMSFPQMFNYTQSEIISSHSEFANQLAIFQIFTALSTGSKIALMAKYEQKYFVNYVKKFKISAAILTSSAIISLVKATENECEIPSLIKVISFGTVLPKSITNQFITRYKHIKDLRQGLFQTECMAPISLMVKNSSDYDSIGLPTPNTKVIIKELESGDQLSTNQIGEICVQREDALCKRYLSGGNAVQHLFDSDGWLHTRDLGYYDEDRQLYCIGSIDEMVRSNNQLIAPTEIEAILLSHSAVSEAAVIAVPDEEVGQIPIGFVVLKPNISGNVFDNEIEEFVNNQLSKKKKLQGLCVMKYLPKTNFGKILKRQLKHEFSLRMNKQKF